VELLILIWLVMGLVGAAIGRTKGRTFAGFAWSFFLGPIGWAIVALGPDLRLKE
jgi:hypothetical protein